MEVLLLTMFVSLCLATLFVVAFTVEWKRRGRRGGVGREALLPFDGIGPGREGGQAAPATSEEPGTPSTTKTV